MNASLANVSVIVPTRDESRNIHRFLASVHPAITLIVVDASTDGTDVMIERARPERTEVIRSGAHIAQARQIGGMAARTPWLIFSDADVRFEHGYFDALPRALRGDAFYGPKYATAAHTLYSRLFNGGQRVLHSLTIPAASGSNMGLRRELFERSGGFRLDLSVNEDTELMLRLWRRGCRVSYAPDLAVRSLDDRRLNRGSVRKLLHSVSRSALLLANLYVPVPDRWLRHDWGYWRPRHARRNHLRDISSGG